MPNNLSWQDDPQGYLGGVLGSPVTVTSGYRTPQHNAAVGGVPNSAHLRDQARDFVPQGISNQEAVNRLVKSGIAFDQVYDEGDHVHVSFDPRNRHQVIQPKMAQNNISDADLMKALTGSTPAAAASPAPGGQASISDEALLKALTQSGPATKPQAANTAPKSTPKASGFIGAKPFTLGDEVMAQIPFAKDVVAGGNALLDRGFNALTGQQGPTIGEGYRNNLSQLNQAQAGYEAAHPNLSMFGKGLGLLVGGAPAAGAVVAGVKAGLPALMREGVRSGAAIGALYGAGTPGEADSLRGRADNALLGGATGAVLGGAMPVVAAMAAKAGRGVGTVANKLFPAMEDKAKGKARSIIENFAGGPVSPDASELVPGSKPTLAEATANPGVAALTRAIRDINPNSPLIAREGQNAAARSQFFEDAAGTPEAVESAMKGRDRAASEQLKTIFSQPGAKPDTAPVRQEIEDILSGPSGARPAVKSAMNDVKAILANDGKPISDPETLYNSARKGIDDLISGKDLTKGYGAQAARELLNVKDKLDEAIEGGAPGFKRYLQDYAEASSPVTSMKFLQGLNLTDAKGNITLAKVQNAIKRLQDQQAAAGVKAGKSVTTAQTEALKALRDDLLRAQNISLGKAIGSNTVQNAMAQQRLGLSRHIDPELAGKGIGSIAGGGLGSVFGPGTAAGGAAVGASIGGTLGRMAGNRLAAKDARMSAAVQNHLEDMLLNPGAYTGATNGPPAPAPSIAQLLESSRGKAALGIANRLAIINGLRSEQGAH